ncbi:ABC transporter substrate-binding protein [Devosia riboflavina]|uniref:ABC transporter substrate-binding protein n=1 Tax=Devosia riboflavina TaxID=46914 RepID=A0A087LZG3_9HYPH|nr:extracellular solute-binding protein [Devosia riboflavina]KFL30016.1 ABC transporter substrate-binding protein [Devosia riboflavina]
MTIAKLVRTVLLGGITAGLVTNAALAADITFWTWRQEDKAAYEQFFAAFTAENPDINVKFEALPDDTYPTMVSTGLAAGKAADVIHTHAYGWLDQFVRSGYLEPLDQAAVPSLANFTPDAIEALSFRENHQVYAVPFATMTLGLFINKDVFEKAGLTPPTTWEEFKTVSEALKAQGIIPLANGLGTSWFNEMFVSVFTGPFLGSDFGAELSTGATTYKDPRYAAALSKLLELRDYMPPNYAGVDYDTAGQLFLSGRAAMLAGGSFDIANYRKLNPAINMDFIAPPAASAGDASHASKFYDGGYAVNAASPNKEAAERLVNWMGTAEFGNMFSNTLGNISPINGVEITDPILHHVAELNQTAVPHLNVVYFRFGKPTGSEILQANITKMMAGDMTPEQVGVEMTNGIATWFAPFQGK